MRCVEVPKIFVDETSARILLAAVYRPRAALQIVRATGLPVAEVFARLRVLERKGLVQAVEHKAGPQGKQVPIYQSMLHSAYVFMEKGKLKVRFQLVTCGQAELSMDQAALL